MICFSMFDIMNLFVKKNNEGRHRAPHFIFVIFFSGCQSVDDGNLGEKVLFRASCCALKSHLLCVSG